jgi:hypothetical protein
MFAWEIGVMTAEPFCEADPVINRLPSPIELEESMRLIDPGCIANVVQRPRP